ncbi:hypothetical protein L1987_15953 [Smallanthus sonchifolius]|uniref:Uncharacterized protein n=1 Tax=Smallanthus sonchifolius TaxID=185202 RepID=A0ACB9J9M9_9ASTR|nr:hypothetical protein L1987_15953 [Smallanthus sonchifolius]
MLHYAYGAVKKSVEAYVTRADGHVIEVKIPYPVTSNNEIIRSFKNVLELGKLNNRKVRLAVIDHITSMPSVIEVGVMTCTVVDHLRQAAEHREKVCMWFRPTKRRPLRLVSGSRAAMGGERKSLGGGKGEDRERMQRE